MSNSLRQQRTISRTASVDGFGYWSGRDVHVEFRPASPNSGIVFVRADLPSSPRVSASVQNRIDVPRRTSLCDGPARVDMVEHVLAALAGLQVDNCEVWVDSPELPGCDGSSLPFVVALDDAGIEQQDVLHERLRVARVVRVGDKRSWVEARPSAGDELIVECRIDFGPVGPIARQSLKLVVTPKSFRQELSAARTFILEQEAEWLRSQGLGTRVTCRDLLVFDEEGPIDNPLRFTDECVRHKTLDVVGDLALAGRELAGNFVAHCSGHRLNAELVRTLLYEVAGNRHLRKTA